MYYINIIFWWMGVIITSGLWVLINACLLEKNFIGKQIWRAINVIGVLIAIYTIVSYTVMNRKSSNLHTYTFFAPHTNGFYREMIMNAFLYFPFGITLSTLIGPISILIGFIISVAIESWQYVTGSGVAQGTDVIMNTLGCAIGAVPWILVKTGVAEKAVEWVKQRMKK